MNSKIKTGALIGIIIGGMTAGTVLLSGHSATVLPTVPGATNPAVTQATINKTICVRGWTATIRPPASYTTALKIKQLKALGWSDQSPADYEEDHLISLELGGNPTSEQNLWPQSYKTSPNAKDKDRVENQLKAQICAGKITLAQAQKDISGDWTKFIQSPTLGSATTMTDPDDE